MRTLRRQVWAVPVIGVAILTTAACGSSSSSSSTSSGATSTMMTSTGAQSAANAQLCADVAALKSAVADFKNLSASGSLSTELAATTAKISQSWSALQQAAASAKTIDTTALSTAVGNFQKTMLALPASGKSPSQALETGKSALTSVEQAAKDVAPGCASSSGS
jgi:hypothetical protein